MSGTNRTPDSTGCWIRVENALTNLPRAVAYGTDSTQLRFAFIATRV